MASTFHKLIRFFAPLALVCYIGPAFGQSGQVGVYPFVVNGPSDIQYLSTALQDALVGSLLKRGVSAVSLPKALDPDRLTASSLGGGKYSRAVAGRINVVGQTHRILIRWVDAGGQTGQDYLEVSGINELIPQVEQFARTRLAVLPVAQAPAAAPEPEVEAPPPPKPSKKEKVKPTPVVVAPPVESAPPPPVSEKVVMKKEKGIKQAPLPIQHTPEPVGDYTLISPRLPFRVRSMAYGDVDGDGQEDLLLTGDRGLYLYRWNGGQVQELGSWVGKKLDTFVKVDVWPQPAGASYVVLTVLRKDIALSQVLKWSGNAFQIVADNIPYQLRVAKKGGEYLFLGSNYQAKQSTKFQVFKMELVGNKVKAGDKLDIPYDLSLYSFDWTPAATGEPDLLGLTPSGKLQHYRWENGKYKKVWGSRQTYGGSGNDVSIEVTDFFNEVTSSFYFVPMNLRAFPDASTPDLVVAKNDPLLKNVVGRTPILADGQLIRLRWDQIGFVESWESKKVDGSISDFRVIDQGGQRQVLAAVRLRNPGLIGDVGQNDSVVLVYNLN